MTKITLTDVGSLIDATSAQTTINNNTSAIVTAFDNTLSRDGTSPNQMASSLDMNGQQIINLPNPATNLSPLRLQDLETFNGGGTISTVPAGGTTGQALKKASNADYNMAWQNETGLTSVGLALPADFTVTGSPLTSNGTLTGTWVNTPTGTGSVVRQTSPTLITPALGTPASGTLTNATGYLASNLSGTAAGINNFLTSPTSANLITAVTDETGSGSLVFATSPTLVTPNIGTPSAGVATNLTGTAAGLTAGTFSTGSATNLTSGTLPAARMPALTGDVTMSVGTTVTTLATGNAGNLNSGILLPARTNGHMNGTATNDNGAAGEVGEVISNTGNATFTTNVPANAGQITLTAGDWDIYGTAVFSGAGATVCSDVRLGINTVTATLPAASAFQYFEFRNSAGITDFFYAPTVGPFRVSITTPTTYFNVAQATFTTSTYGASGGIRARRVR